ncbi:MAG: polysaccharide export protein [Polyangiaceae bacterium]|nr:polysaccharide export protein [Polyangiaceae bacterium]
MRALPLFFLLVACGARPGPPTALPAPVHSSRIGAGDVFEVHVLGEKDLPAEYRVQPDGSIDFPYVRRLTVEGKEPQEVAELLRARLRDAGILRDPQVSVVMKQYFSKRVSVVGQVTKPGTIAWTDGLRLVDALSQSGWLTPLADANHVTLIRRVGDHTVAATISVDAITEGSQGDIPLQAGDTIKVDQRFM